MNDDSTQARGGEQSTAQEPPRRSKPTADLKPGDRVDRYIIREAIGEGGFATVYLAEQTEPVARQVALKIIKLGMDTKEVLARFEAERQALALMDHAHVAKVFDAGMTDKGRPYFVMEHVAGDAITEYCDRNRLPLAERLELFMQACAAVQHAHQKGIIHRDIKPTNVLVTAKNGKPTVKVIDFGVAKALHGRLSDSTVHTMHGQFIGTPEYMSPEQAEMTGVDVDTRTDVYSLGVLLYQLLTGETPFQPQLRQTGNPADVQRIIREEDPAKPSTRLSTMGERCSEIARQRRLEVRPLTRRVKGELDWIVMKALEKDRTRRYETANGLAMDVKRYLDDEPVVAGPPGATYRMRKFLHRNRAAVTAGMAVTLALIIGLSMALYFWRQSENQKLKLAKQQETIATLIGEAGLSLAVIPLVNVSGDPDQDSLAVGMTSEIVAELQTVRSLHVKSLDASYKLWSREVKPTPAEFAREMNVELLLGGNTQEVGGDVQVNVWLMYGESGERFWGETFSESEARIEALERRASEAVAAAVTFELPRDDQRVAREDARDPRARRAYQKGLLKLRAPDQDAIDQAIEFFTQAIEIDPKYAKAYASRAEAYYAMLLTGMRTPSEFMPQSLADAKEAIRLDDSIAEAHTVAGLAYLHYFWDWELAEESFRKGLEVNPRSALAHLGMAAFHVSAGRFQESTEHLRTAVELDPGTLLVHDQYLYVPFNARQPELVLEFAREAFELDENYWATHGWYGLALAWSGEMELAMEAVDEAVRLEPDIPMAMVLRGTVYAMAGETEIVDQILDELLDVTDPDKPDALYTCPYEIACIYIALGDTATAMELLRRALAYKSECMPFLGSDPRMDVLRSDPEFQGLMDTVDVMYRGPELEPDDQ